MYYLNKIIGWAASPIGLLFLGLGVVAVCAVMKRRRLAWIAGIASAVLFWVLGCGVTTRIVGGGLECDEIDLPTEHADAIVLLGGGMGAHAKCGRSEMFGSADRVWMAAKLWKAALAPKMTLSGGGVEKSTIPLLKEFGIPEDSLLFFPKARNTEEESKLIAATGIKKILLVTSAWHMKRSIMLFERAGFEVIPAPTDYEMHCALERPIEVGDFFPKSEALILNSYAVKEWVARFFYWLKG